MRMVWRPRSCGANQPSIGRPDRALDLTDQAKAYRQIKQWVDKDGLELEEVLSLVLPAPPGINGKVGKRFNERAAKGVCLFDQWPDVSRQVPRRAPQPTRPGFL